MAKFDANTKINGASLPYEAFANGIVTPYVFLDLHYGPIPVFILSFIFTRDYINYRLKEEGLSELSNVIPHRSLALLYNCSLKTIKRGFNTLLYDGVVKFDTTQWRNGLPKTYYIDYGLIHKKLGYEGTCGHGVDAMKRFMDIVVPSRSN